APSIRVCCHPLQPLSEEKAIRGFIINRVTEKNQKTSKVLTGKMGRFCQKSSADACAGWSRKASPPTQLDSILCQGHPVAVRTCSIAFVTLCEELSTVCKRWSPDRDIEGEERPGPASSPASPCSRLDALPRGPAFVQAAALGPAAASPSASPPSWPTGRPGWW